MIFIQNQWTSLKVRCIYVHYHNRVVLLLYLYSYNTKATFSTTSFSTETSQASYIFLSFAVILMTLCSDLLPRKAHLTARYSMRCRVSEMFG